MKKILLLVVISCLLLAGADGGSEQVSPDQAQPHVEQNVEKRIRDLDLKAAVSIIAVSMGFGIASGLSNRAIDAREVVRAQRLARLQYQAQAINSWPVHRERDLSVQHQVVAGPGGTSVGRSTQSDPRVLLAAASDLFTLHDRVCFGRAKNAPNTVFTIPVKKNASDLLWLTGNYAAVSWVKYRFMTDEERKIWAQDNKGSLYPLPHLDFSEIILGMLGQVMGRALLDYTRLNLPFGFSYGNNGFRFGY